MNQLCSRTFYSSDCFNVSICYEVTFCETCRATHCEIGLRKGVTRCNVSDTTRNRCVKLKLFNFWWNLSRNENGHWFMTTRGVTRCNVSWNLSRHGVARQASQFVASCNTSFNFLVKTGRSVLPGRTIVWSGGQQPISSYVPQNERKRNNLIIISQSSFLGPYAKVRMLVGYWTVRGFTAFDYSTLKRH